MTYGEIAAKIARERRLDSMSAQAVGGAVGKKHDDTLNIIFIIG